MNNHDLLIEKLGREMQPVKPTLRTGWRVLMWLALALPCGIAASLLVERTLTDWSQPGAMRAIVQLVLAFILGLLAIRSAFNMSIAGRQSNSWKVLLPLGMLWLGLSLSSIPHAVIEPHDNDSARCFTFLLVVSTPMMVLMIASLRRTRALHPVRSLAMAGLGVACMAVTMLAFCHPVHLHAMDFLMHLAAIVVIVAMTVLLGKRWVRLG
ncbi:NrsF family protein [Type-D symbiont of Plautia stali]|uniref:NrsF family protein n=1 Tax=Type-D symbiont of Plautia stali TaxID=1560356 RepID=UPI00073EF50E|nr:NrsF family protein [Type-D symbiont of Plautia stali]